MTSSGPKREGKPSSASFAEIWQAADKVVYSKTLDTVASTRTRIERDFVAESVSAMKASADRDVSVGGSELVHYRIGA